MNISAPFILRPVMTTLLMAALIIFGVIAYFQLPVSDLPSVDFPSIMVMATLPGANADTMASAVATPLERQFATIAGLDSMSSQSSIGVTNITLQFNLSRLQATPTPNGGASYFYQGQSCQSADSLSSRQLAQFTSLQSR